MIFFHAGLAEAGCFPTQYVILGSGESFLVGTGQDGGIGFQKLKEAMKVPPIGDAPLCAMVATIAQEIRKFDTFLISNNKKACIIVATDGEASDGELGGAMTVLQVSTLA
jgi:hypothetical protein